jgi:hypothetical protein
LASYTSQIDVVVAEAMGMARFEDNRQDEGVAVPN